MLPTLEHLLGIDSKNYLQVGQDMLSTQHQQITAFRSSNNFVTPKYTSFNGRTYYTQTGEEITILTKPSRRSWMRFAMLPILS